MPNTRQIFSLLVVGVALAVLLAGCAPKADRTVEIGAADAGSRQTIAVGQQLRISLESNPTTGYQWALDGEVPAQLEQIGDPEYTAESDAIGAGGTEVWTFAGKLAGTETLRLKYWRSFEPEATPEETFEVEVEVR